MDHPMMTCGHSANATKHVEGVNIPACAICMCDTIDLAPPSLEGRMARCSYGPHADVPSSGSLAFFSIRPEREFDDYYCGCRGWD